MAPRPLEGMRVAIVVTENFEQSELTTPKLALEEAGAQALIVSSASLFGFSGWSNRKSRMIIAAHLRSTAHDVLNDSSASSFLSSTIFMSSLAAV